MRILQIGSAPPEVGGLTKGGLASHLWDLSINLRKKGHTIGIIADNIPYKKNPEKKEGITVYGCYKLPPKLVFPSIFKNTKKILKLQSYIDKEDIGLLINSPYYKEVFDQFKPDIIHIHGQADRFPPAYFMNKRNIPIVVTIHGISTVKFSFPDKWDKFIKRTKKNARLINDLIFVSKYVESEFKRYIGDFKGDSYIIYNPIDSKKFYQVNKKDVRAKLNLSLDVPIVLFVGSLTKRKGEYVLLETTKILIEKGVNLKVVMIGDGPELNGVEHYVNENKLSNTVALIKSIPQSELLLYYNAADLFVMPSFSEAFALTYLEVMLCGVPVIATKGVCDESVPSENYGFLIPSGDAKSLAETIELGLSKKWNTEEIIEYARSFSWDRRISEFESVYDGILMRQG